MAVTTRSGRDWSLDVRRDWIDITAGVPSPNERWVFTDSHGHEHRYDKGYPTLDFVVDEQHWCMGNEGLYAHDPHWAVDESHYECKACRERIRPAVDPPGTPKGIPGPWDATLKGRVPDGRTITVALSEDELQRVWSAGDDADAVVLDVLSSAPRERTIRVEFSSF